MTRELSSAYRPEDLTRSRATALTLATVLGDICQDELVIVGGLVPPLLIDQERLPAGASRHIGTADVDVALAVSIRDDGRYEEIADRLRRAGFEPDTKENGNKSLQRWRYTKDPALLVDFMMSAADTHTKAPGIVHLTGDLGATAADGLELAWRDRLKVTLMGTTIDGARASRDVWVCGPAAFVVLKAIAFRNRGENKDAYDLFYVLRNYGSTPAEIGEKARGFGKDPTFLRAKEILKQDFTDLGGVGAVRAAKFEGRERDEGLRADVVAYVGAFLRALTPG